MNRETSGHGLGVTRRGLGYRVVLIGVRKHGAIAVEPAESAGELRKEPLEVVRAHLIDGDEDDQIGSRRGCGIRGRSCLCAGRAGRTGRDKYSCRCGEQNGGGSHS